MGDKVNLAVVGLSGRGSGLLGVLLEMPDVNIIGLSDRYEDRLANATARVRDKRGVMVQSSTDYRRLLDIPWLDAVITPSSWTSHVRVLLDSMEAGKYAATEVGGATSVQQCWELVRTSERTGKPCMLLENCCYNREEMTIFNMVREGLFGELVHAAGGYEHDLRSEVGRGDINRHYRLANYTHRNGELYPTHELGPIAKWFDINRGNRFLTLSSTASKAAGLHAWLQDNRPEDTELKNRRINQGDVVTTVIKCARGETIVLTHDTTLPRPYSRGNRLQGTKGIWLEDNYSVYFDGISPKADVWESLNNYYEKYEHPLWKWYRTEGIRGGHGGMDYLVLRAFVEAVKNGTQTPIDVYDTATWMAVTALSEDSVALGGHPVPFPDFTDGAWIDPRPIVEGRYCLEKVCPA